ncbi:hypothetical protein [Proteocatella sphenisci]|uniref:hypothetical protein n=1 Tax=Proteocatella sphenisci TaxID=181070 RepID=UPI0004B0358F|nr:hypothetical protein [Proteocatella sphenisci]
MNDIHVNAIRNIQRNEPTKNISKKNVVEKDKDKDKIDINALKMSVEEQKSNIKNMVRDLVEKQGFKFNASSLVFRDGKLFNEDDKEIKIDKVTSLKAQADIAEDGFWGVKKTSERIIDFAKSITGGDSSKIDLIKNAIKDGFKAAEKMFGGNLPEISSQTYDTVMKALDEWNTDK